MNLFSNALVITHLQINILLLFTILCNMSLSYKYKSRPIKSTDIGWLETVNIMRFQLGSTIEVVHTRIGHVGFTT